MRYGIALTGIAALTLLGVPAYGATAHADPLITTIGPYGYAVTGSTYTSSTADWTMPTLKCTTSGASISIWTGLDGYSSPTVEQIGAEAVCESGTAEYFGWYDMYPGASVDFSNTLLPGDKLDASVSYSSPDFTLTLQDVTQGWTKTVVKALAGADRSSAETTVEVPSNLSCTPHETLAAFTDDTVDGTALGSLSPIEENGGNPHITVSAASGKTFTVTCT
jgi:Peptidase A4 family